MVGGCSVSSMPRWRRSKEGKGGMKAAAESRAEQGRRRLGKEQRKRAAAQFGNGGERRDTEEARWVAAALVLIEGAARVPRVWRRSSASVSTARHATEDGGARGRAQEGAGAGVLGRGRSWPCHRAAAAAALPGSVLLLGQGRGGARPGRVGRLAGPRQKKGGNREQASWAPRLCSGGGRDGAQEGNISHF